ncbi:hypothetical protein [Sinomonas susongensis]|uniref:hypothetical protein n=1 Tax=Sinomonas susongensis TaxID=1324851 RepID=UPI001108E067|nr:hypothetical protein [Sinomonas susongensis]
MIDGIPILSVQTITPVGLYILLVLLLFFERVVPIGRVRAAEKIADYWRESSETKQATIEKQADTINVLTKEVGATVAKVMGEIQQKAGVDS